MKHLYMPDIEAFLSQLGRKTFEQSVFFSLYAISAQYAQFPNLGIFAHIADIAL